MLLSNPVPFVFRGSSATMQVVRNDGYCWGLITVRCTGQRFDVNTLADWYDVADDVATAAFIRASTDPSKVSATVRIGA